MGTDLETERGVYLAPKFKEAERRIGDDALNWLLRFIQRPLPKEKTLEWEDLLHELMLLIHFWRSKSIQWSGEPRWEGTSIVVDFKAADQARTPPCWATIRLPPAKEVQEIQATLKTWLHELMETERFLISVPNISELTFSLGKHRKAGQNRRIYIGGGYKESFLLNVASILEDGYEWFRSCPFRSCATPIFFALNKNQKFCSPAHAGATRSRIFYRNSRMRGPHWVIEGGDHEKQLHYVHTHLLFPGVLPSQPKAIPKKKPPNHKKTGKKNANS